MHIKDVRWHWHIITYGNTDYTDEECKKVLCLSVSGKWSARSLYYWVHILHKGTDVSCAKLSFRHITAIICTIHRMGTSNSCLSMLYFFFWKYFCKYLKALRWTESSLEPQPVKNENMSLSRTYRMKRNTVMIFVLCCSSPCLISLSFLSLLHLSPDSTVSHSLISLMYNSLSCLSWLLSWMQIASRLLQYQLRNVRAKGKLYCIFIPLMSSFLSLVWRFSHPSFLVSFSVTIPALKGSLCPITSSEDCFFLVSELSFTATFFTGVNFFHIFVFPPQCPLFLNFFHALSYSEFIVYK